jgi:hypothetical protein
MAPARRRPSRPGSGALCRTGVVSRARKGSTQLCERTTHRLEKSGAAAAALGAWLGEASCAALPGAEGSPRWPIGAPVRRGGRGASQRSAVVYRGSGRRAREGRDRLCTRRAVQRLDGDETGSHSWQVQKQSESG